MNHITIKDIAKKAGISTATVSLALNNVKGRVSDEVSEKVKAIAVELGYSPNLNAKNLRSATNNLILLIYSGYYLDEQNASPMKFIGNIIKRTENAGKHVIIQTTQKSVNWDDEISKYVNLWNTNQFDCIVFMPAIEDNITDNFFHELYYTHNVNLIVVLPEGSAKDYPIIHTDHYLHMWQALDLVSNKGYNNIYYICMEYGENPPERVRAYLDYISKKHINGSVLKYNDFFRNKDDLEALIRPLIENQTEDVAFACWNDVDAINILEILRLKRYYGKYRIGVIGYDDLNISKHTVPALTTVYNPYEEIAEKALNYVLNSSNYHKDNPPDISVYGYIVERDSL